MPAAQNPRLQTNTFWWALSGARILCEPACTVKITSELCWNLRGFFLCEPAGAHTHKVRAMRRQLALTVRTSKRGRTDDTPGRTKKNNRNCSQGATECHIECKYTCPLWSNIVEELCRSLPRHPTRNCSEERVHWSDQRPKVSHQTVGYVPQHFRHREHAVHWPVCWFCQHARAHTHTHKHRRLAGTWSDQTGKGHVHQW